MKTILVDAVDTIVSGTGVVFKDVHDLVEGFPNKKIILTNADDAQFIEFGLDKMPYEVFTLKHSPDKIDPVYFQKMLEHFSLTADSVVYFEHNQKAVESASSCGIPSYYFDPEKRDIDELKKFLTENL
ncbi:MAG: hypothetical protein KBC81_01710 [Candidatus Pacebacteria bacterium]|nr:hypothetical protein [Candidatus Paceibacterota bacterium]